MSPPPSPADVIRLVTTTENEPRAPKALARPSNLPRDLTESACWLEDAVKDSFKRKADIQLNGPKNSKICTTGLESLDGIIGGFKPGQMYLVEGSTGGGKTSFVFNSMMSLAKIAKEFSLAPVLFFSLEMTQDDVSNCAISWLTEISKSAVQDGDYKRILTDDQLDDISQALDFSERAFRLVSTTDATAKEIRVMARKAHAEHGVSAIVCDYIGLIDADPGSRKNREQEIGDSSRMMRAMAIELNVPVIVLSQISRAGDKEDTPYIGMARDSGRTEADAPVVLFVWPTPDHDEELLRLYVMKNRFGQKEVYVTVRFDRKTGRLTDASPADTPHSAWEDNEPTPKASKKSRRSR